MTEKSKYIKSESVELKRSAINLADYNPRLISDEARKNLKRGIKKYGLVGGIIANKQTGMTLVSGHQRLSVMDELNKYPANDYILRVDIIDVDSTKEKELNILLNNPNAMGSWDMDALAELIPDIDYKAAGLTEEDLSLIGCDFLFQTEEESNLADSLNDVMAPIQEMKASDKAERQLEKAEKVAHMKDLKKQVREDSAEKAQDMEAYVMLSFSTYEAKTTFMQRFGYDKDEKFITGEIFSEIIERVE